MSDSNFYYVGDLCYVLTDSEWDQVCAGDLDGLNYIGDRPYSIFRTEHGDGIYAGNDDAAYCVDSGTIGCIHVSNVSDLSLLETALEKGLGHLHDFFSEFTASDAYCEDGVMTFDNLIIETA